MAELRVSPRAGWISSFTLSENRKRPGWLLFAPRPDSDPMKKLFTSEVVSKGARSGTVRSADGTIDTQLGNPLDPKTPRGPNPETFFAAAYSACFHGALQNAAKKHGTELKDSRLTVRVSLNEDDSQGYFLSVEILAQMPGVDRAQAEKILGTAHETCPYSKLSRGESKVEVRLV